MDLRVLHLISTYALLSLGTIGLWMGETQEGHVYPYIVIACAIAAFALTDVLGVFRLSDLFGNACAVVMLAAIVVEFFRDSNERIIILAHLLVYLQIAMFFREKRPAVFWMLYTLNLLQLCIACVVNRSLSFGALLGGYTALAFITLGLFHLARHQERLPRTGGGRRRNRSWPIETSVAAQFIGLCFVSLPVVCIFFSMAPRVAEGTLTLGAANPSSDRMLVGFTDSVSLNEIGTIMEQDEVVFTVTAQAADGQPVELPDEVLWRGMVFTTYENKGWHAAEGRRLRRPTSWMRLPALSEGQIELIVDQKIIVGNTLFCPQPLHAAVVDKQDMIVQFFESEGLLRLAGQSDRRRSIGELPYRMITDFGPSAGRSMRPTRAPRPLYLANATSVPANLIRLKRLADNLTEGVDPADTDEKISRIMNYLLHSGEFEYSFVIEPHDSQIDPVEDFLFNRKAGHCEYFASALALMLRQTGIATRVVNGFKGTDYNELGEFYQVRELLAHSWVEAYVPEELAWRTLDPTPGEARALQIASRRSMFEPVKEMVAAADKWWAGKVLGFSDEDRRQLMATFTGSIRQQLRGFTRNTRASIVAVLHEIRSVGFWLSWKGPLLILVVIATYRLRGVIGRIRHRAGALFRRRHGNAMLPVYDQWLVVLRRRGFERRVNETPREFAATLHDNWRRNPQALSWSELPLELVDCYYALRYGGQCPDPHKLDKLAERVHLFARDAARVDLTV